VWVGGRGPVEARSHRSRGSEDPRSAPPPPPPPPPPLRPGDGTDAHTAAGVEPVSDSAPKHALAVSVQRPGGGELATSTSTSINVLNEGVVAADAGAGAGAGRGRAPAAPAPVATGTASASPCTVRRCRLNR